MIEILCPECGQSLIAHESSTGKCATCPECGADITVTRQEKDREDPVLAELTRVYDSFKRHNRILWQGLLILSLLGALGVTIACYGVLGVGMTVFLALLEAMIVLVLICVFGALSLNATRAASQAIDSMCARFGKGRRELLRIARESLPESSTLFLFLHRMLEDTVDTESVLAGRIAIDFRSDEERQYEREASAALGGEDEKLARRLGALQQRTDDRNYVSPEARQEIRRIGEYLGANGGNARMQRVAYRVQYLGGSSRLLELFWEGICGWHP